MLVIVTKNACVVFVQRTNYSILMLLNDECVQINSIQQQNTNTKCNKLHSDKKHTAVTYLAHAFCDGQAAAAENSLKNHNTRSRKFDLRTHKALLLAEESLYKKYTMKVMVIHSPRH